MQPSMLPSIFLLPPELLLLILSYLDIPDLLSTSRTCHLLRTLSLDPNLHASRLHRAFVNLTHYLPIRPPLSELMGQRIYITRTSLAARSLSHNLIRIKLNRQLSRRPSAESLVGRGVLPVECFGHLNASVNTPGGAKREPGVRGYIGLAPSLIETKRRVERERVKDKLRGWVEEWRRRWERRAGEEHAKPDVRRMARRFARDGNAKGEGEREPRWGRAAGREREEPTRAKVLGLRRFWETVGKEGTAS
ncbi:hypothetical protein M430DRAFT_58691 [Amorphotheca resinae ATCC 22711]|uniref:F-box domain-containing protein n=1 Tax=Amorphotheca resinae ATCC 22711 TaxID=857342 RepID=A0A2T3B1V3_AMORE|nr:hypothetical protein M430DRAFT_58691 [Amorphotheca resinae ATCC 22711]PSS18544.1 hypothetical protein M430DRAFT_58691 [Amorphotheca resinae ATCC 22711]